MTAEQRKRLEDAMVASQLENLTNVDSIDSLSEEVERAMRFGQRGFAEMDDDELITEAKAYIAYDEEAAEEGGVEDWPGTEKLGQLVAAIREIAR